MKRWIKNSKKGMAVLVAVAFMLVAGWQVGATDDVNIQGNEEIVSYASSGTPCGGPKDRATAQCLSENTINCRDLTGCQ